jgi:L-asparaginase
MMKRESIKKRRQKGILVIYTGGTIGMVRRAEDNALVPVDFSQITQHVPELQRFDFPIAAHAFDPPMDSSNMDIGIWGELAEIIREHYAQYEGFVLLHGTDTMSYTASALSFMLEDLCKPVIFTGAQLPIGTIRTDGKENLVTAIEIAAARKNGLPLVQEVCIYFEFKLHRANRTTKNNAEAFNAFRSYNFPFLGEAGTEITYREDLLLHTEQKGELGVSTTLENNIVSAQLFPGINPANLHALTSIPGIRALLLQTYGSGNAPNQKWFLDFIEQTTGRGIIVLNISQCKMGTVQMEKYQTGKGLLERGVISGRDMTYEAAVAKLMYVLGKEKSPEKAKQLLCTSLKGEMS